MAAHALSVPSNQCISDLLSSSSSSLFIVFLTFPVLFQSVFLNLGEERARLRGRGCGGVFIRWMVICSNDWKTAEGDYCAILSRVLPGAKVTILHDNPQVITRSLLLLWSSRHNSCFVLFCLNIYYNQVFRQSISEYKNAVFFHFDWRFDQVVCLHGRWSNTVWCLHALTLLIRTAVCKSDVLVQFSVNSFERVVISYFPTV